jgi:hypothetical protein
LSFDLASAIRTIKPQKRTRPLERRSDAELSWATAEPAVGAPVLLDACLYVDVLQGRTPEAVDQLLTYRICHHSAVCLAELTHVFGRLDPAHPSTKGVLRMVRATIVDIPSHRLHAPEAEIWGRAGMLAGALFRLGGLPAGLGHERKLLNDALIYLQARQLGCAVLTRNVRNFDFLNQLTPGGRVIFYPQGSADR